MNYRVTYSVGAGASAYYDARTKADALAFIAYKLREKPSLTVTITRTR